MKANNKQTKLLFKLRQSEQERQRGKEVGRQEDGSKVCISHVSYNTLLISLNCTLLAHENVTTDFYFLVSFVLGFFLSFSFIRHGGWLQLSPLT